jgi:hypothetical protein
VGKAHPEFLGSSLFFSVKFHRRLFEMLRSLVEFYIFNWTFLIVLSFNYLCNAGSPTPQTDKIQKVSISTKEKSLILRHESLGSKGSKDKERRWN